MNPYFSDVRPPVVPGFQPFNGGADWGRTGEVPPPPPAWGSLWQDVGHQPPKPGRVRPWVWVVAATAIFLSACLIGAATLVAGAGSQPDSGGFTSVPVTGNSAAPAAGRTAKVGDTVRSGGAEFKVNAVKCGIRQVGNDFLSRKAQGSFCRVDISVKNAGSDPILFHADSEIKAEDTTGRTFEPDGEAGIYGNKDGAGFLDDINPGNQVRAYVYFDLPKGAKIKEIEIRAGLFDDEVEISVTGK